MLSFVYVFGNALQLMSSSLKNVIFYEEDDDEGRYKNIETLFERHQDSRFPNHDDRFYFPARNIAIIANANRNLDSFPSRPSVSK